MSINSTLNRLKAHRVVAALVRRIPSPLKARARRAIDRWTGPSVLQQILAQTSQTNDLLARMMYEQALTSPRFQEPKRLLRNGFKVYSQHDEDGIVEEIFRRIGTEDRFFVEFGVGDGLENCTLYLLLRGWSGVWIDGSAACLEGVRKNLGFALKSGHLLAKESFITGENIEGLFAEMRVPEQFDFLSIDIDRNDFWVWRALKHFRPRVVALEYNASFKQSVSCAVPYDASAIWDGSSYTGCSLKALEYLAAEKGYSLVGCNYTGVTSFFIRNDCLGSHFAEPYTSENHYEPPRYFVRMPNGHRPSIGPVTPIRPGGSLPRV